MRHLIPSFIALLLTAVLPAAAADTPAPVYRHHSIGSTGFLQATQGTTFQQVWKLAQTGAVRDHVVSAVAGAFLAHDLKIASGSVTSSIPAFKELIVDIVEQESVMEVHGTPGAYEWLVAVNLPADRMSRWTQILGEVSAGAGFGAAEAAGWEGISGKVARSSTRQWRWATSGTWLFTGLGTQLGGWDVLLRNQKTSGRPLPKLETNWLALSADLGALQASFPMIPTFAAGRLELAFRGKDDQVRTEARLNLAQPHGWTPSPWQIPTNSIRDPLVGFTAARGVSSLFARHPDVRTLGLTQLPDQAFTWSMSVVPFFLFGAAPLNDVSNRLWEAFPRLPTVITNYGNLSGNLSFVTNTAQILWQGMPFMLPNLRPMQDGGREYLFAAMAPTPQAKTRAPEELFGFVSKPQLAFFEWEITEERVSAWRRIYQATLLGFLRNPPRTNTPAFQLMLALEGGSRLGNTASEITVTGPSELSFSRSGHLGLTGFEIVSALRWIDSSNFPFTFESAGSMDFRQLALEAQKARGGGKQGGDARIITPVPPSPAIPASPAPKPPPQ